MLTIPMCKIIVQHLILKEIVGMVCVSECVCMCVCVCVCVCVHVCCLHVCFSFIQHPGDNVRIINTARNVSELYQLVRNFRHTHSFIKEELRSDVAQV